MGGRPLDESELVERAKRGDVQAYEMLVRTHQQVAFRTAYVVSGGVFDAQDAVQEAFVKAYYALGRFREGNAFRPWLLRIVANESINRRRAARRQVNLAARAAEGRPPGGAVPSPEGVALEQEQRREVVEAVGKLRPEDRLVIAYRFWFEMSEAEMADALGCARGTVKSRLSRALARLRDVLQASGTTARAGGEQVAADG